MKQQRSAREEMLERIRAAIQDVPAEPATSGPATPAYRRSGSLERAALIERFSERISDYKVLVRRSEASQLPQAIAAACRQQGIQSLALPADLPAEWLPVEIELLRDDPPLSNEQLNSCGGVLSGCALGIAQTGTLILDGGSAQGRRVLTLLPDYHLCIIREEQIVELVPEAISALHQAVRDLHRPLTFISGPSATSDIELNRVEGVHGPRRLEVLIVC